MDPISEEDKEFIETFNKVIANRSCMENFAKFLNFEPIKILWNSEGSESFKGFAHSDSLLNIFKDNILVHKGDPNRPYTFQNIETVRKHFMRIKDEYEVSYNFVPFLMT